MNQPSHGGLFQPPFGKSLKSLRFERVAILDEAVGHMPLVYGIVLDLLDLLLQFIGVQLCKISEVRIEGLIHPALIGEFDKVLL